MGKVKSKKATKASKRALVSDRIAEYVGSSRLKQRVKSGKSLSCLILGNYGTYHTRASLRRNRHQDSSCSCPSEYWPCKHVHALVLTYQKHPSSFVDVEKVLTPLKGRSKEELLKTIRLMIEAAPASLQALGVKGFEEISEEEDDGSW